MQLLEVINQQMKMVQSIVTMLYTQNPKEPVDLVKAQVLITLNDPKTREVKNKVD